MKKINLLAFVFLILSSKSLVAQDLITVFQLKTDSLYQLIESRIADDEEKVFLLNEYARLNFYDLKFQTGLEATVKARDISKQLNFTGGQIMYYQTLAAFHGSGELYQYYQKKAELLSKSSDKQLSKYYVDLTVKYPDVIPKKSLPDLLSTYAFFEKIGEKEIQASIIDWLTGFYFWMEKDLPNTYKYNAIALKIYKELGETYPYFVFATLNMTALNFEGKTNEAKKIELELVDLIAKSDDKNMIGPITSSMASGYSNSGRFALAIEYRLKSIEALKNTGDQVSLAEAYRLLGIDYENLEMDSKASESYSNFLSVSELLKDSSQLYLAYDYMVSPLIAMKKYDEARKYLKLTLRDTTSENKTRIIARYNDAEGQMLRDQGKYQEAIVFFRKAFDGFAKQQSSRWSTPFMPLYIAECYLKTGEYKKAEENALQCLKLETALDSKRMIIKGKISLLLSEIYDKSGQQQKAYQYLKTYQEIRAESDRLDETNRIADAEVRSVLEKSQKEIDKIKEEKLLSGQQNRIQRLWIFSISGALISVLFLSLILLRNNKSKQKSNTLLKAQKEEVQHTLEKLKATQSQLIQSEKMASLGELTAGIAHEIQNPLNFVNNFSEVNSELIQEMKDEIEKGNLEEVKALANDIADNEQKINHHGKRADAIVKGMLQHSRSSSGVKEPTNINALADEYLRLAYHGLRAKDKSFNATMKTDFDETMGMINVIPQDIGRVILNLITNAFYAVTEKKTAPQPPEGGLYEPTVTVSTSFIPPSGEQRGAVLISVKDNGNGIPQTALDKIFQPFFTTKPSGQGTGLGLSMSYEIVTKVHGGELKVETKIGEGSEFTIYLPA